ncbi:hypothetical protein BVG79_00641 [Ketogulonicigenium robustum]|uniref:Uncharacterized protein n=1 Tax=Ketogulonicigenium robustum TaxID=92947 RepID=A0A1W6NXV1_9RHOB|nr:hypothetical protein BVG79_00641 [Ketogulonicigenium robustum]
MAHQPAPRRRSWLGTGGRVGHYVLLAALALFTSSQTLQLLKAMPFAEIAAQQTAAQLHASLTRAVNQAATPDHLAALIDSAVATSDREMADALVALAAARGIALPAATRAAYDDMVARLDNPLTRAGDCVACAFSFDNCQSISQTLWCKGPVILTPVDDVFVLSDAGLAALQGREVDRLDVALATVGLGATALVLVTGGSSYLIKAGAGALKIAKKMGRLPPALLRTLRDAADIPINWSRLDDLALARAPLSSVVDTARLAPLGRMAGDFGQVVGRTSVADGIRLLGYVDDAGDMARIARVTDAVGKDAPRTFEVLGKSRVFRIAARLSDNVIGLITGLLLMAGQWAALLGGLLAQFATRVLRRSLRGR